MAPRRHMRDACKIGTYDIVSTGPEPTEAWTYGAETRCRFLKTSTTEIVDGDRHHQTSTDIHLPAGVTVSDSTRIQITKRNGSTISPVEYFNVKGDPWFTTDNKIVVCRCESVPIGAE